MSNVGTYKCSFERIQVGMNPLADSAITAFSGKLKDNNIRKANDETRVTMFSARENLKTRNW